jgi:hypothetical protein
VFGVWKAHAAVTRAANGGRRLATRLRFYHQVQRTLRFRGQVTGERTRAGHERSPGHPA